MAFVIKIRAGKKNSVIAREGRKDQKSRWSDKNTDGGEKN